MAGKVSRTVTKEIVQHQGWLYKRGEGYEGDEPGAAGGGITSPNGQPSSNTLKRGFFKDLKGNTGGGAAGGISSNNNNNATTNKGSPRGDDNPVDLFNNNAELLLNGIERMLRGKGEKKRFFKLVTLEERLGPGGGESSLSNGISSMSYSQSRALRPSEVYQMRVELRYYSKESAEPSSLKGVVNISADCEVVTRSDDANFKLITPGRCYYLRPDGDASSGAGITAAFQWSDAIRRQIRSLFAMQQVLTRQASALNMLGSSEGSTPASPMMSAPSRARLLRAESNMVVEPEAIPATLGEVLAHSETRNDFRTFLDTALAIENLQFYEELEKLKAVGGDEFKSRVSKLIEEYVVAGSPCEVNLSSAQRNSILKKRNAITLTDFDEAKAEIFKLMEDNFFKRFYREAMEKTGAFAALYATLGIDGFNAVLQHFGPVKTDLERMLLTYRGRLRRAEGTVEQIRKELTSASREVSVSNQSTSIRALFAAYHVTVVRLEAMTEFVDEMRNQVVSPLEALALKIEHDIQTIHQSVRTQVAELEECKKLIQSIKGDMERTKVGSITAAQFEQLKIELVEGEVALENLETLHSKPIEAAMAKLESLELYRIETQRQVVRYASIAEKNMMNEMSRASEMFCTASKSIQIERDIKELTLGIEKDLNSHHRA